MTPRGSRTLVDRDSRHVDVAAGLLFTLAAIPMMTYGDEIGMRGEYGEDGWRLMTWNTELSDDPVRFDDAEQSSDDEERSDCRGRVARYSRSIRDSSQRVTSVMLCDTGV